MGAYKFYNPTTQQWEIIKSKSIIKDDGSLEYTPDDIQEIDNKIGILNTKVSPETVLTTTSQNLSGAVNEIKVEVNEHKMEIASQTTYGHIKLEDIPTPTKSSIGLGNVDNVKQMPIAGGNFTGISKAHNNTFYTVAQLRNVILSTGDAVVGSMSDGDIWIKYK